MSNAQKDVTGSETARDPATSTTASEEVATMVHAFSDEGRRKAVRDLAARVRRLEEDRDRWLNWAADNQNLHERALKAAHERGLREGAGRPTPKDEEAPHCPGRISPESAAAINAIANAAAAPRVPIGSAEHVELWDAIHAYARASYSGNERAPSSARASAVSRVESALRSLVAPEQRRESDRVGWDAAIDAVASMIETGDAWEGHQGEGTSPSVDAGPLFAMKEAIVERVRAMRGRESDREPCPACLFPDLTNVHAPKAHPEYPAGPIPPRERATETAQGAPTSGSVEHAISIALRHLIAARERIEDGDDYLDDGPVANAVRDGIAWVRRARDGYRESGGDGGGDLRAALAIAEAGRDRWKEIATEMREERDRYRAALKQMAGLSSSPDPEGGKSQ